MIEKEMLEKCVASGIIKTNVDKKFPSTFVHMRAGAGQQNSPSNDQFMQENDAFSASDSRRLCFLGAGNNPMVGMTVSVAVAVEESYK